MMSSLNCRPFASFDFFERHSSTHNVVRVSPVVVVVAPFAFHSSAHLVSPIRQTRIYALISMSWADARVWCWAAVETHGRPLALAPACVAAAVDDEHVALRAQRSFDSMLSWSCRGTLARR